uniref:Uncharacterized protein n=1 Tax=Triticum urartu TaxID=4572 RepID=A0A8R7UUM2_TRIUA
MQRRYMPGFLRMKNTPTVTNLKASCLRMMLDVLLETLELPTTEYRSKACDGGRVCVTVFFHTPTSYVEDHGSRMAIPGVQCIDHAMSEDTTAMEAIVYIKCMVNTELRDYN